MSDPYAFPEAPEQLLSPEAMAAARWMQRRAMPDTCQVRRRTDVADTWGTVTSTWATVYVGLPCRVGQVNSIAQHLEISVGEQERDRGMVTITVPVLTDAHGAIELLGTDRITVTRDDAAAGLATTIYEVLRPLPSSYQTAQQVLAGRSTATEV